MNMIWAWQEADAHVRFEYARRGHELEQVPPAYGLEPITPQRSDDLAGYEHAQDVIVRVEAIVAEGTPEWMARWVVVHEMGSVITRNSRLL